MIVDIFVDDITEIRAVVVVCSSVVTGIATFVIVCVSVKVVRVLAVGFSVVNDSIADDFTSCDVGVVRMLDCGVTECVTLLIWLARVSRSMEESAAVTIEASVSL